MDLNAFLGTLYAPLPSRKPQSLWARLLLACCSTSCVAPTQSSPACVSAALASVRRLPPSARRSVCLRTGWLCTRLCSSPPCARSRTRQTAPARLPSHPPPCWLSDTLRTHPHGSRQRARLCSCCVRGRSALDRRDTPLTPLYLKSRRHTLAVHRPTHRRAARVGDIACSTHCFSD
jgi:hypothetical protein